MTFVQIKAKMLSLLLLITLTASLPPALAAPSRSADQIVPLEKQGQAIASIGAIGVAAKVYVAGREYKGTYLTNARDTGLAFRSGLKTGDVLIRINSSSPYNARTTESIVRSLGSSSATIYFVRKTRNGLRFGQKVVGWSKNALVTQKPDRPDSKPKYKGTVNTGALQTYMYRLVNEDRKKNGLPELRVSGKLEQVARGHSSDMATRNYTSHFDPEGKGFADRGKAAGIQAGVAENIGKMLIEPNSTEAQLIAKCQDLLMHSSRHRFNLLNKDNKSIGIGMAVHKDGSIAVTQMFATVPNP